jgi:PIN domain nuclease of toxin-antitoxin system
MARELLLDTHTALWWADNPSVLSPEARELLENPVTTVWFSAASAWELSIKVRSGKLIVDIGRLVSQLAGNSVHMFGISVDDAMAAGSLDWDHRDPFDRMLVVQARRAGALVVTRDEAIVSFMGNDVVIA